MNEVIKKFVKKIVNYVKKEPVRIPGIPTMTGEPTLSDIVKLDLLYKKDKKEFINTVKNLSQKVKEILAKQYYNLAKAYMRKETDPLSVIQDLEKSYILAPNDYTTAYELGVMYLELKLYNEAKEIFFQLYKRNNKDIKLICNLAETCMGMDDYNNGAKYFEIARRLAPSDEIKKNIDDWMYYYMNERERIVEIKRRLLEAKNDITARVALAEIYLNKGRYKECVSLLEEISSDTNSPIVFYVLGIAYYELGFYGKSQIALNKVISLNVGFPRLGETYLYLGMIYEHEKNYDLATEMYLKGLEMDKYNNKLYFRIGNCYAQKNMYDEAMEYYRKGKMLQF